MAIQSRPQAVDARQDMEPIRRRIIDIITHEVRLYHEEIKQRENLLAKQEAHLVNCQVACNVADEERKAAHAISFAKYENFALALEASGLSIESYPAELKQKCEIIKKLDERIAELIEESNQQKKEMKERQEKCIEDIAVEKRRIQELEGYIHDAEGLLTRACSTQNLRLLTMISDNLDSN